MTMDINEWLVSTEAELDAGKSPRLPTAREFGKMCPDLRTAEMTLFVCWCDAKDRSEITVPFFRWLRLVRGERFELRQPPDSFELDTLYPVWKFSGSRFALGDYKNGLEYSCGYLEDLSIDSKPLVEEVASLVLRIKKAETL